MTVPAQSTGLQPQVIEPKAHVYPDFYLSGGRNSRLSQIVYSIADEKTPDENTAAIGK